MLQPLLMFVNGHRVFFLVDFLKYLDPLLMVGSNNGKKKLKDSLSFKDEKSVSMNYWTMLL